MIALCLLFVIAVTLLGEKWETNNKNGFILCKPQVKSYPFHSKFIAIFFKKLCNHAISRLCHNTMLDDKRGVEFTLHFVPKGLIHCIYEVLHHWHWICDLLNRLWKFTVHEFCLQMNYVPCMISVQGTKPRYCSHYTESFRHLLCQKLAPK